MKRLGLDLAAFKAIVKKDGNPHANDLPAYEPGDGPLTVEDLAAIEKEAAKSLPKRRLLARQDLFEKQSTWGSFLNSDLRASDDFLAGVEKLAVPKDAS